MSRVVPAVVAMIAATGIVGAALWMAALPPRATIPEVAQAAGAERPLAHATAGDASCIDCHAAEVAAQRSSPHAITLTAARDRIAAAFADATPASDQSGRFVVREGQLMLEQPETTAPVSIDWIFGSGLHARTPVSTWLDPDGSTVLLEHALSWYPPGFIAPTLGTADSRARAGLEACGKLLDPETTRACFGCHATRVPTVNGRIDETAVAAGVGCVRCHADADRHVAAMHAGAPDPTAGAWQRRTPLESIRACGECHRRDDQLTPDELRPDNLLLVRFAPVGLSQSACFQNQSALRLDCMTCHDPHAAADRRPSAHAERCLSCHGPAAPHPPCPTSPATSDCTTCHMPKVEVQPHLQFTDHWIRVRSTESTTAP
jgi:hypothetical protein